MWAFFSSSYTSARINKVLVEIEMDQQPLPLQQQQQQQQQQVQSAAVPDDNSRPEPVSKAVEALHAIQDVQGDSFNDDSDSEEEDRAIKDDEPVSTAKELNVGLLEKLIDQPNLVQEIQMGKNTKLLSYISQEDVLDVLIGYLINSVPCFEKLYFEEHNKSSPGTPTETSHETFDETDSDDSDDTDAELTDDKKDEEDEEELPYGKETPEEKYRRRASTAGEILSVQDPPIVAQRLLLPITDKDAIKSNEVSHFKLLRKLWNGMMSIDYQIENIINLTLFVKIVENLINLNPNELMNFIRQNQKSHPAVDEIIRHAAIPQLMELWIKFISLDRIDHPIGLIEILHEQNLVSRLVKLLDSDSLFLQNSVGDFFTSLISISANTPSLFDTDGENLAAQLDSAIIGPNELTRSLVSEENIECISSIILKGGLCLPTCVSLIIEIIRKNNSDYDPIDLMDTDFTMNSPHNREPIFIGTMLKVFSARLTKIFNRFFGPQYKLDEIETTLGTAEPVGFERFKIVELIAELLHCSNMMLLNNVDAEEAIAKRNNFKTQQLDLMSDALAENIVNDIDDGDDLSRKHYTTSMHDRSYSNDTHLSENHVGGGDGSTSLIDLEKLTNDIKNFAIDANSQADPGEKEVEEEDVTKPDDISIGDFFKVQLLSGDILVQIFSMLDKFPWNNFLHNVIFDIAQQVLNGRYDDQNLNRELIMDLFDREKCYLTNYIVNCFEKSAEREEKENLRLGYMGHLVLISEELVKFSGKVYSAVNDRSLLSESQDISDEVATELFENNEKIHEIISEQKWIDFVNNELVAIRDMYNQVLGGVRPDENDTYLNPSTILLGNGEENSEEAIDEFDDADVDSNAESVQFEDVEGNGDVVNCADSEQSSDKETEEEFGGDLCPVQKHNETENES